jgi:murein DD-endopeptidase MepM/ murein hydrolase activator NlpD
MQVCQDGRGGAIGDSYNAPRSQATEGAPAAAAVGALAWSGVKVRPNSSGHPEWAPNEAPAGVDHSGQVKAWRSRRNRLMDYIARTTQRCTQFVAHRPRSLVGALVIVLTGFGATAFGIAPLAPDADLLPKRVVSEIVAPEAMEEQLAALAERELQLYRSELTRNSDTVDSLLRRLNVDDAAAAAFLRSDSTARKLLEGRAGKMVQVRVDEGGVLEELVARYPALDSDRFSTHFTRLRITRLAGGLQARLEIAPLASQVRMGSGSIRTSLFAATDEAGVPDGVASQLAEIFATDIDFHRELRRGDTFSVVYEALTADGEPITWNQATGRVMAAEFASNGRNYSALWFKDVLGRGSYYSFDGKSKRRTFLASPMEFSRVTSGFAMRMHPILQNWRAHLGIDYGAPAGTPVRSVGDGNIEFAGWQNGYGNVVQIAHGNGRATTYAHLSRVDVRKGQHVEQGQRVGAVGATGWATGPHLHFEFRVNGQHQDPLAIAKASETVAITPASKQQFELLAASAKAQLESAQTIALSGGAE